MAEHYRLTIAEKTREALARLQATGRRYTRVLPYGYRATAEWRLVPEPAEQRVLVRIRTLAAAGVSVRGIARALATAGVRNRPFPFQAVAALRGRQAIVL